MNRVRGFFSNLTGERLSDTSDLKAEEGDYSLEDLNDFIYPITKAEMLETLRNNGSSKLLIAEVEKVPQNTFNSLEDLRNKLGVPPGATHASPGTAERL